MTEMRRRMEAELKLRGCSERTQEAYLAPICRALSPPSAADGIAGGARLSR